MDTDLVSVVVAVYRSERFLDKLVTSILDQTYTNLDIILVDDGSPDNSGAICDSYAKRDERVRVIHKANGGACEARNVGVSAAVGDYLVIIDGDDWLAPDYIEYLLNLIHRPGVNMSMTDSIFTTRDCAQNDTDEIVDLTAEEAITRIIYGQVPIGPWNKMYSMKIIKENNISFSTKWSGEGLYYSTMAAQASDRVALGHRRIYYYRLNNDNSGLTNYNVTMGLNALENIFLIKRSLAICTKKTMAACDWHIWKNYNYLLFLIIATRQQVRYADQYRDCKHNIRTRLPFVIINSDLRLKEKMRMLVMGLFPVCWARRSLLLEQRARSLDRFE